MSSAISRIAAVAALSLVVAGCRSRTSPDAGRGTPRQALAAFLAAAREKDVDAMGLVWGTERGAAADFMERGEREKRILIIQCHLAHERSQVVSEYPGENGRQAYRVSLTLGSATAETTMQVVKGASGRWFVESVDIEKTAALCQMAGIGRPANP